MSDRSTHERSGRLVRDMLHTALRIGTGIRAVRHREPWIPQGGVHCLRSGKQRLLIARRRALATKRVAAPASPLSRTDSRPPEV